MVSQVVASAGGNVDPMFSVYDSNAEADVIYSAAGTNSVIPMGQAFAVRVLTNNLTITPNENWKTTTNNPTLGLLKTNTYTLITFLMTSYWI